LGRRYVWGAVGPKVFDCSGFTKYVFRQKGINIPRTSIQQSKYGTSIQRAKLKPGDLVFFDTSRPRKGYVNHVGIYMGNNKFIHASSAKKRVIITRLDKPFYSKRYTGARRIIN
jgi:cell wall-associated NlpC family hydrolase